MNEQAYVVLSGIVEPDGDKLSSTKKKDTMEHQGKGLQDFRKDHGYNYEASMRNWRAWGSWFSWGSPVGLGLFFISIAVTLWILSQAFGWK